jgi:hypothetical protein
MRGVEYTAAILLHAIFLNIIIITTIVIVIIIIIIIIVIITIIFTIIVIIIIIITVIIIVIIIIIIIIIINVQLYRTLHDTGTALFFAVYERAKTYASDDLKLTGPMLGASVYGVAAVAFGVSSVILGKVVTVTVSLSLCLFLSNLYLTHSLSLCVSLSVSLPLSLSPSHSYNTQTCDFLNLSLLLSCYSPSRADQS